jgi:predicted acyltransferase
MTELNTNAGSIKTLPQRLSSLDAFRGFVMFLMGTELLELDTVAEHFPKSTLWQWIGFHSAHVPWSGCSLHDLIHPAFSFMIGVSLVFSMTGRQSRGQSKRQLMLHALWRAFTLVLLGIFVHSMGHDETNWTFDDTLTQAGLGYPFLFLLGYASARVRWVSFAAILVGYWLFFACHPVIPPHLDRDAFNIPLDWTHDFTGFFAHWNLNCNAAWSVDMGLLNLFPRPSPYIGYYGGYTTLNFIPTLATMILGLIAGTWLKQESTGDLTPKTVLQRLLVVGVVGIASAYALHYGGICPIVKRLWTPAWVLLSGGWSCLFMAAFHYVMDVKKHERWAFPFTVIGVNSIAMYLLFHRMDDFIDENLQRHFGEEVFLIFGPELEPAMHGAGILLGLWLVLFWMHRRRLFLKV